MSKVTTLIRTYEQLAQFNDGARLWLSQHPDKTKFRYAAERVFKRTQSLLGNYQEDIEELNIENCAVDDKGIILMEPPRYPNQPPEYKFTKEGLLKRNKDRLKLFRTKKVELEPYYATEVPELTEAESDIFIDFVIKERPPDPTVSTPKPPEPPK
jgi:hypothetical protein